MTAQIGSMRVLSSYKRGWGKVRPSFVLKALHGRGAGYIGGWTVFVAFNSGSRAWQRAHRNDCKHDGKRQSLFTRLTSIEVGFTRNANLVPYVS